MLATDAEGALSENTACWGSGAGRALLADLVAKVDVDATSAYLETDRPELERYYRGAGFEVRERIQVFGVPVLLMERPARSASLR